MMERGLWGFFDGTEKKPDDESGIAAWKKKDQKAFATLISRIGINLVSSVRMCIKLEASAHEAWKRLETIHVNKTLHGKILARNAFYTVKMRAGESMHEYATRVEELGETFMDLGGAVTEEDWILTLLCGLPEEWSTVITTLDSVQDTWMKEMVVGRLLHEESCRRQFANESVETAMFSGGSSGGKSKWSKGATKKSYGGSDRGKGNASNGASKCHYCGKAGHFWRECRKRPSDWTPSKARNHEGNAHTASGEADDSSESIVLLAGDGNNTPSDAWFLDTGATQHMTHSASFLTNVGAPRDVKRVVFGNNKSLPVVGVGSTRLIVDSGPVDITNVLHVPGLKARAAIYLGIAANERAWRVWDLGERRVVTSRDVVFDEDKFPSKEQPMPQHTVLLPAREEDEAVEVSSQVDNEAESGGGENEESDDDVVEVPPTEEATPSAPSSLPLALTRGRRTPRPNTKLADYATVAVGELDEERAAYCFATMGDDPRTHAEALASPDAPLWKQAMEKELASIKENDVLIPQLKTVFGAQQANEFNLTKVHDMAHLVDDIVRSGVPVHYNANMFEYLHQPLVKRAYRATNKRNAEPQIVQHDVRSHMLRSLQAADSNSVDGPHRMVALQEAIGKGVNTFAAGSFNVNWRLNWCDASDAWKEHVALAPGDMTRLKTLLGSLEEGGTKVSSTIHVKKGMAIPGDEDFTRYSSQAHYVRAMPSFMDSPWFSDVAVLGEEGEKKVMWYARLLCLFVADVFTTARDEVEQREYAFVRFYKVTDEEHRSHCPVLTWDDAGTEYHLIDAETVLRVAHVVPLGDGRFLLNKFKFY
ncbi:unnamed protein product [Closterium sp. NIES-64]|nr:unnamed protein product [Closterium sp. NIES-64]